MQKTQNSEKNIMFHVKNCKIEAFLMRILVWKRKKDPGEAWGTFFETSHGNQLVEESKNP